jgi:hypothetical protein
MDVVDDRPSRLFTERDEVGSMGEVPRRTGAKARPNDEIGSSSTYRIGAAGTSTPPPLRRDSKYVYPDDVGCAEFPRCASRDRLDIDSVNEREPVDLYGRKRATNGRAGRYGAARVASLEDDPFAGGLVFRDRCERHLEVGEILGRDQLRNELVEPGRIEEVVTSWSGADEFAPPHTKRDINQSIRARARRDGATNHSARTRPADHIGRQTGTFEGAQDAQMGETSNRAAAESEAENRPLILIYRHHRDRNGR